MRAARVEITPLCRPCLSAHVHLRFDVFHARHIVLAPEKILWPDEISASILDRCDGSASVGDIAEALARDYDAPTATVEADILEFLQDWSDRLLIDVADSGSGISGARSEASK